MITVVDSISVRPILLHLGTRYLLFQPIIQNGSILILDILDNGVQHEEMEMLVSEQQLQQVDLKFGIIMLEMSSCISDEPIMLVSAQEVCEQH